jgi:competence protein ComFC
LSVNEKHQLAQTLFFSLKSRSYILIKIRLLFIFIYLFVILNIMIHFSSLEGILFPTDCLICDKPLPWEQKGLCVACHRHIQVLEGPLCCLCGQMLPPFMHEARCRDCKRQKRSFSYGASFLKYTRGLSKIIRRLKVRGNLEGLILIERWADAWAQQLKKTLPPFDLITSVPTTYFEGLRRHNHLSEILAKRVAKRLNQPYKPLLKKVRRTSLQSSLSREKRLHNLGKAFNVRCNETIRDKTILVIDDIFTTGATFESVSKCLRTMGAVKVLALSLARSGRYENS